MNPANKMAHEQLQLSGEVIEEAALKLRELATHEPETQAMVTKLLDLRAQQKKVHDEIGGDPARAAEVARTISAGDFTQTVPLQPDDTSSLMYFMAHMQSSLAAMTRNIQDAAEAIDVAANEIRVGNMDLSARTESQATGLEQTAAAMEEITSASQEQSIGIGEIGQAVRQIDDTTQQNTALVASGFAQKFRFQLQ